MKRNFLLILFFMVVINIRAFATGDVPHVYDNAGLLSQEELSTLSAHVDDLNAKYNFDLVFVTVNSIGSKTPMEYADDFYDNGGFDPDGTLFLIAMDSRDFYSSSTGFGSTSMTPEARDNVEDLILDDLKGGNYFNAFMAYTDTMDEYIALAKEGTPYDGSLTQSDMIIVYGIIFVVACIIALIYVSILKSKMNTAHKERQAKTYLVNDSVNIYNKSDMFMYSTVTRHEKPKDNSSDSSTHTSSGGVEHTGGGGKF